MSSPIRHFLSKYLSNLRLIQATLLATILLTPLLQANHPFGYEQVKVIFFISAITLLSVLLIIYLSMSKTHIPLKFSTINKIALSFISVLFIASIFGVNPMASIFGIQSYYQGAILYFFLFIFYILVKLVKIPLKVYSTVLLLSGVLVSIDALLEWVQLHMLNIVIPTYNGRVVSTFGQPNLYSGFLLLILPLSMTLFATSKKSLKIPIGIAIFLSILAIILSESRASIILLILLMGFYISRLGKRFIIITLLAFILLTFSILPTLIRREVLDPFNNLWLSKNAPEKRILIWQVAASQIPNRPLLGYGLESFRYAYQDYFSKRPNTSDKAFLNMKNLIVDRAHNYTLDLFIFSGIGGVLWIILVFSLIKRARGVLLISLLLYLVWIQVQIQSVIHLMYFWVLAAFIDSKK